jgi:hypothetical protein
VIRLTSTWTFLLAPSGILSKPLLGDLLRPSLPLHILASERAVECINIDAGTGLMHEVPDLVEGAVFIRWGPGGHC